MDWIKLAEDNEAEAERLREKIKKKEAQRKSASARKFLASTNLDREIEILKNMEVDCRLMAYSMRKRAAEEKRE